ncbi:MAG: hypothetical protein NTY61_02760 [Candidatus Parcubacteria bacterium]|nr:hypothetical protein [Candidatus Parcubacteria bacterium]
MPEPDQIAMPKADDMFVILPILMWANAKTYGSVWFGGQLMTGAELLKYAVSKLNLDPLAATIYKIANALPSGKVLMMLTNPLPKED